MPGAVRSCVVERDLSNVRSCAIEPHRYRPWSKLHASTRAATANTSRTTSASGIGSTGTPVQSPRHSRGRRPPLFRFPGCYFTGFPRVCALSIRTSGTVWKPGLGGVCGRDISVVSALEQALANWDEKSRRGSVDGPRPIQRAAPHPRPAPPPPRPRPRAPQPQRDAGARAWRRAALRRAPTHRLEARRRRSSARERGVPAPPVPLPAAARRPASS